MSQPFSADNCHFDVLSHKGSIQRKDDQNYYVSIIAQSACSSCHSKGVCNSSEMKEKVIEVPRLPGDNFQEGDSVEVLMKKSLGTKAVIIGYVLPFALLLGSLIGFFNILQSEGMAGIISISVVTIYYGFLYLFRNRLKRTFTFSIRS